MINNLMLYCYFKTFKTHNLISKLFNERKFSIKTINTSIIAFTVNTTTHLLHLNSLNQNFLVYTYLLKKCIQPPPFNSFLFSTTSRLPNIAYHTKNIHRPEVNCHLWLRKNYLREATFFTFPLFIYNCNLVQQQLMLQHFDDCNLMTT